VLEPGKIHDVEDYQDRLRISTPEGVTVDLVLAGLGSRFTASSLDLLLKGLIVGAGWIVAAQFGDLGLALGSILTFAVYFGYDIGFEVLSGGRTPGKRWTGLRVLREDGRPVDLLSSAIRNIVRLVDGLPLMYLPAMASVLVTRRNQRLGDLAGSTIVVREPRRAASVTAAAPAPAAAGAAPTFNGFALPHGIGLSAPPAPRADREPLDVSAVSADDLLAVRSFLDRRAELPPGPRGDLARRIAGALAPRVGGATEHLHDEDLIEAVAAAKARGGAAPSTSCDG
jgi:uncharacterized RDD family membrane protein YckC